MSEFRKPKLADAVPQTGEPPHPEHPDHPHDDAHKADVKQENREANDGLNPTRTASSRSAAASKPPAATTTNRKWSGHASSRLGATAAS